MAQSVTSRGVVWSASRTGFSPVRRRRKYPELSVSVSSMLPLGPSTETRCRSLGTDWPMSTLVVTSRSERGGFAVEDEDRSAGSRVLCCPCRRIRLRDWSARHHRRDGTVRVYAALWMPDETVAWRPTR